MVFYFFSTGKEIQPLQVNPLFYYFQDTFWQKMKKLRGMQPFSLKLKLQSGSHELVLFVSDTVKSI